MRVRLNLVPINKRLSLVLCFTIRAILQSSKRENNSYSSTKKDNDEQQTNKEAALLASTVRGD